MKISLPQSYKFQDIAEVSNNILYINKLGHFQDLMYDLTYNIKDGKKCYYCGYPLTREKSTLDHMFPKDLGGPTLPINLAISCSSCNNKKSNLTEEEFLFYLSLPEFKRKEYLQDALMHKNFVKKWYCPLIPKEWISNQSVSKITVHFFIDETIKGKSYRKVSKFYNKYGHLFRPVIVDKNFKLLDGFNTLIFAKNNAILNVPVIILENVELII